MGFSRLEQTEGNKKAATGTDLAWKARLSVHAVVQKTIITAIAAGPPG